VLCRDVRLWKWFQFLDDSLEAVILRFRQMLATLQQADLSTNGLCVLC